MSDYRRNTYSIKRRNRRRRRNTVRLLVLLTLIIISIMLLMKQCSKTPSEQIIEPTPTQVIIEQTPSPTEEPMQSKPPTETPIQKGGDLLQILKKTDGVKIAYLTFDDGPTTSITPRILDILKEKDVKATFFQLGTLIESNPQMAQRVYEEGHLIANHSYTHNYNELYANKTAFISEIEKVQELIKNTIGQTTDFKVFRFPGGFVGGKWAENKKEYAQWLTENGYYYCDWNSLNGDAEGAKRTAQELIDRVKETTKTQEKAIILMHDAATKGTTADALPEIIDYLKSEGYTFARLDEINKENIN